MRGVRLWLPSLGNRHPCSGSVAARRGRTGVLGDDEDDRAEVASPACSLQSRKDHGPKGVPNAEKLEPGGEVAQIHLPTAVRGRVPWWRPEADVLRWVQSLNCRRSSMHISLAPTPLLALPVTSPAATIRVDLSGGGDFTHIQPAIDAASARGSHAGGLSTCTLPPEVGRRPRVGKRAIRSLGCSSARSSPRQR
jgi:hypothetical protein